jgi:hypothetical protein
MDVKDPSLEVAMELERIALTDDYFVQVVRILRACSQ